MKNYLKKKKERGINVREVRRMVYDGSEWQRFVRGNAWAKPEDEPLTLMKYLSFGFPCLYEA